MHGPHPRTVNIKPPCGVVVSAHHEHVAGIELVEDAAVSRLPRT
jgi:hypothetical protein